MITKKLLGWFCMFDIDCRKLCSCFSVTVLFMFLLSSAKAQNNNVSGKITDSSGNPLQGVSVVVKGGKTGTSTNANGSFQLNGLTDRSTLVISFIGFGTQEIRLASGQ